MQTDFVRVEQITDPVILDVIFTKIVDLDTPVPGGTGTFRAPFRSGFGVPAISHGNVGFRGFVGNSTNSGILSQEGIYKFVDGQLVKVADRHDSIYVAANNTVFFFQDFMGPSIDNRNVAFWGRDRATPAPEGIFTDVNGLLSDIININTPIPGTPLTFERPQLSPPSFDKGWMTFTTNSLLKIKGIYTNVGGSLITVADENTLIPGGVGTFLLENGALPFDNAGIDDGHIVFLGRGSDSQKGIYKSLDPVGGVLELVADRNTEIPDYLTPGHTFTNLVSPVIDGENVVFVGYGPGGFYGLYSDVGGSLDVIADSNTRVNGIILGQIFTPSLDNGHIAFLNSQRNIYTNLCGPIERVVNSDNPLDGKALTTSTLITGNEALSDNQIAFRAIFADNTQGIYTATMNPRKNPFKICTLTLPPVPPICRILPPRGACPPGFGCPWAQLVTGSPVSLSQKVAIPDTPVTLGFDYLFGTTTGILSVFVNGTEILNLAAPSTIASDI